MPIVNKTNIIIFVLILLIFLLVRISIPPLHKTLAAPYVTHVVHSGVENYEKNLLILYNRIPKTGSTSFMSVMYDLHLKNKISLAYVNVSSQSHRFTFLDQYKFVKNVSFWNERKPAMYHGHFPFLDFTKFSLPQPMYINIIRKPLDRFVSHYYFLRYGDTFRPKKIRTHQGDTTTFDECVIEKGNSCDPKKLWLQIPYFCGSDPECWDPGNKKALQKAKANVANHYFLVGITEELDKFIELLEKSIPRFFRSTLKTYLQQDGGVRIRKTKVKKPLQRSTVEYFRKSKIWQMENEFYNFVLKRFRYIYKSHQFSKGVMQVSYVKVKP